MKKSFEQPAVTTAPRQKVGHGKKDDRAEYQWGRICFIVATLPIISVGTGMLLLALDPGTNLGIALCWGALLLPFSIPLAFVMFYAGRAYLRAPPAKDTSQDQH